MAFKLIDLLNTPPISHVSIPDDFNFLSNLEQLTELVTAFNNCTQPTIPMTHYSPDSKKHSQTQTDLSRAMIEDFIKVLILNGYNHPILYVITGKKSDTTSIVEKLRVLDECKPFVYIGTKEHVLSTFQNTVLTTKVTIPQKLISQNERYKTISTKSIELNNNVIITTAQELKKENFIAPLQLIPFGLMIFEAPSGTLLSIVEGDQAFFRNNFYFWKAIVSPREESHVVHPGLEALNITSLPTTVPAKVVEPVKKVSKQKQPSIVNFTEKVFVIDQNELEKLKYHEILSQFVDISATSELLNTLNSSFAHSKVCSKSKFLDLFISSALSYNKHLLSDFTILIISSASTIKQLYTKLNVHSFSKKVVKTLLTIDSSEAIITKVAPSLADHGANVVFISDLDLLSLTHLVLKQEKGHEISDSRNPITIYDEIFQSSSPLVYAFSCSPTPFNITSAVQKLAESFFSASNLLLTHLLANNDLNFTQLELSQSSKVYSMLEIAKKHLSAKNIIDVGLVFMTHFYKDHSSFILSTAFSQNEFEPALVTHLLSSPMPSLQTDDPLAIFEITNNAVELFPSTLTDNFTYENNTPSSPSYALSTGSVPITSYLILKDFFNIDETELASLSHETYKDADLHPELPNFTRFSSVSAFFSPNSLTKLLSELKSVPKSNDPFWNNRNNMITTDNFTAIEIPSSPLPKKASRPSTTSSSKMLKYHDFLYLPSITEHGFSEYPSSLELCVEDCSKDAVVSEPPESFPIFWDIAGTFDEEIKITLLQEICNFGFIHCTSPTDNFRLLYDYLQRVKPEHNFAELIPAMDKFLVNFIRWLFYNYHLDKTAFLPEKLHSIYINKYANVETLYQRIKMVTILAESQSHGPIFCADGRLKEDWRLRLNTKPVQSSLPFPYNQSGCIWTHEHDLLLLSIEAKVGFGNHTPLLCLVPELKGVVFRELQYTGYRGPKKGGIYGDQAFSEFLSVRLEYLVSHMTPPGLLMK